MAPEQGSGLFRARRFRSSSTDLPGLSRLFQQTCRRLTGELFGELSILSNYQHRFLVQEQLQEIGLSAANIVLEPASRNTAAAACIAALMAGRS